MSLDFCITEIGRSSAPHRYAPVFSAHWYTSIPISLTTVVNIVITITYANTINKQHRLNEPMKRKCQNVNNAKG